LTQSKTNRRQCPTRLDGADPLIAHWITESTCCDRRHRNYHKCFGCTFGHSDVATVTLTPQPRPAPTKKVKSPAPAAAAV